MDGIYFHGKLYLANCDMVIVTTLYDKSIFGWMIEEREFCIFFKVDYRVYVF